MSKPFDYSKWDNIELSDDEDDVHPNIERESWFRMKHRARVEREEKEEADKKRIQTEMSKADLRMEEIRRFLQSLHGNNDDSDDDELEDVEGLEAELEELRKANLARQTKLDEFEKNKKWNVDNMCRVVEERTIINPSAATQEFSSSGYVLPNDDNDNDKAVKAVSKDASKIHISDNGTTTTTATAKSTTATAKKESIPSKPSAPTPTTSPAKPPSATEPEAPNVAILSYSQFVDKYASLLEQYMTLSSLDKSKDFLLLHANILLQENASNYLLLASLEDEMNGLRDKMRLTARQSQIISNITELAKSLGRHPGSVIVPFFKRMEDKECFANFTEGVDAFIQKIIKRAVDKKKEIDAERQQEEEQEGEGKEVDLTSIPKEERLGPGGLDPLEVFDTLPVSMQEAFESREVDQLKQALLQMDPKDAEYHMKRCVDSGLWTDPSSS